MGAVTGEALECGDAGVLFGEEGIAGLRSGCVFGRREQVGEDVGQRDLSSDAGAKGARRMERWIKYRFVREYRRMRPDGRKRVERARDELRLAACGGRPASEEKIVREFLRLPPEGRREVLDVLEMCVRQGLQCPQGEYPAARASSAEL